MSGRASVPSVDTLLLCACITTVGLYTCAIWERNLRIRQQQLYIDAAIRVLDVVWNGRGAGGGRHSAPQPGPGPRSGGARNSA